MAARDRRVGDNAQMWSADGDDRGDIGGAFGDAIEHVLTTAGGSVWVGYFDEALGGRGPQAHGAGPVHRGPRRRLGTPPAQAWPIIVDLRTP